MLVECESALQTMLNMAELLESTEKATLDQMHNSWLMMLMLDSLSQWILWGAIWKL